MSITRTRFCVSLAGSTLLPWLPGCGGGGDYGGGSGGGGGVSCGASGTAIAGNHGHTLTLLKADLDSLAPITRSFTGSDHSHDVTFSPAELAQLKAGATVIVVSTSGAGIYGAHTHSTTTSVASTCP